MKRIIISFTTLLLVNNLLSGQSLPSTSEKISKNDIQKHINYLASDGLKGRKPGTYEDSLSRLYILSAFKSYGLIPMFNNGFQIFPVVTGKSVDSSSFIQFGNIRKTASKDFFPLLISSDSTITGECIYVDFGIIYSSDSLNIDNFKGKDVKGKIAVISRGYPDYGKRDWLNDYSDERTKALNAKDRGAIGVIFFTPDFVENGKPPVEESIGNIHFPVAWASLALLQEILYFTNDTATAKINNENIKERQITLKTQLITNTLHTSNVTAFIPGSDPKLKDEYLVIGAHYDHLGMGGLGSGSRRPDTLAIHNGADDNASGVAGILELAEKLSKSKTKPRRSIIFVAFGAEEMGLLGSKYFTQNPPVELSKIKGMFNLDMIGRLDDNSKSLLIGGTGTSVEADTILKMKNQGFNLKFSPEGFGPSDHSSFYSKNIPVFFFNSGAHEDYHTPDDDANKINFKGEEIILNYIHDVVTEVANRNNSLTFKESGEKERPTERTKLKVTLGIMPDFTAQESKGLRVDGVRKDGPAFKAGIQKGDIITALDGKPVTNIQDYMSRLKVLKPGSIINVDLLRDGKKLILIIQL